MKIVNHTKMTKKKLQKIMDFVIPNDRRQSIMDHFGNFTIEFVEGKDEFGLNRTSFRNKTITLIYNRHYAYPYNEAQEQKELKENDPYLYRSKLRELEKITGTKYEDEYIGVLYLSATEALVFAAAHECFHLSQAAQALDNKDPEPVLSNKHADMFALSKLREWRRLYNKPVYQDPLLESFNS